MPYHGVRGDFLLGLVKEGGSFSQEEKVLAGIRLCVLTLPQGTMRRRIAIERGIRGFGRMQVRRCIFPENFSHSYCFAERQINAVDVEPLLRKKAGHWVLAERQARGLAGSIAVMAEQLTEDVENAIRLLLEKSGSVSMLSIRGTAELQRELRRDCGAVLRLLPKLQLSAAETLLDFSSSSLKGQALTLRIGENKTPEFLLPWELREEFPPMTNTAQLAVVLWELGRTEIELIGLKSRI